MENNRRGTVHSVYERTVNLQMGTRLVALQPWGTAVSPLSLMTEEDQDTFEKAGIKPGNRVEFDGSVLWMETAAESGERWALRETETVDLKLRIGSLQSPVTDMPDNFDRMLNLMGKGRSIFLEGYPEALESLSKSAKQIIEVSRIFMRQGKWEKAAETLSRLLGLGIGLTPSGDDFLCGFLAGMAVTGMDGHLFFHILKTQIRGGMERTNDISRAFLECALQGQFAWAVHCVFQKPFAEGVRKMAGIGHTSGIDTLCGLCFGLEFQKYQWRRMNAEIRYIDH